MYNMEYNQDKNYKYLYQKYKKKYLNLKKKIYGGNDLDYSLILDKELIIPKEESNITILEKGSIIPKEEIDEMYYESDTTYNELKVAIVNYFKKIHKFDINVDEISLKSKNKKNKKIKKEYGDDLIEDDIDILVEVNKKPVDVISLGLANRTVNMKTGFDLVDNFLDVNGKPYKGDIKDGLPNGKGIGFNKFGFKYEGEWLNGLPHGKGKENRNNGSTYDGDWIRGVPNGKGILVLVDGSTFEGDFVDGNYNGFGTFIKKDKFIQEGNWSDNFPNGKSKVEFFDGYSYDGDFIMGVKDGSGIEFFPKGNKNMEYKYVGQFKNNLRNGKGKMIYYDDFVYEGDWVNNRWHGIGTIVDKDVTFVGNFIMGEKNGDGIVYYNNGNKLEGPYSNDKKNGKFVLTDDQGTLIEELHFINDVQVNPENYPEDYREFIENPTLEKFTLPNLLIDQPYSHSEDQSQSISREPSISTEPSISRETSISREPSISRETSQQNDQEDKQDELDENISAKNILERINSN